MRKYLLLVPAVGVVFAATAASSATQTDLDLVRTMTAVNVDVLGRSTNLFLLVVAGATFQSIGLLITQIPDKIPGNNKAVVGIGTGIHVVANGFLVSPIQELQSLPLQKWSLITGGVIVLVGVGFAIVDPASIRIDPND